MKPDTSSSLLSLSVRLRTVPCIPSSSTMSLMDINQLNAADFGGPQSPMEMKPDTSLLTTVNSSPMMSQSPNSASTSFMGFGSPGGGQKSPPPGTYPPSHPLSGAKHMCSICGDRARNPLLLALTPLPTPCQEPSTCAASVETEPVVNTMVFTHVKGVRGSLKGQ